MRWHSFQNYMQTRGIERYLLLKRTTMSLPSRANRARKSYGACRLAFLMHSIAFSVRWTFCLEILLEHIFLISKQRDCIFKDVGLSLAKHGRSTIFAAKIRRLSQLGNMLLCYGQRKNSWTHYAFRRTDNWWSTHKTLETIIAPPECDQYLVLSRMVKPVLTLGVKLHRHISSDKTVPSKSIQKGLLLVDENESHAFDKLIQTSLLKPILTIPWSDIPLVVDTSASVFLVEPLYSRSN